MLLTWIYQSSKAGITREDSLQKSALCHIEEFEQDLKITIAKYSVQNKIRSRPAATRNYLNQQLKTIQEELGSSNEEKLEEMRLKAKSKKWTKIG